MLKMYGQCVGQCIGIMQHFWTSLALSAWYSGQKLSSSLATSFSIPFKKLINKSMDIASNPNDWNLYNYLKWCYLLNTLYQHALSLDLFVLLQLLFTLVHLYAGISRMVSYRSTDAGVFLIWYRYILLREASWYSIPLTFPTNVDGSLCVCVCVCVCVSIFVVYLNVSPCDDRIM